VTSTTAELSAHRTTSASALVVANPTAGSVFPGLVDEVGVRLRDVYGSVEQVWTAARGDAGTLVASSHADVVVAIGGDGTVREVAEAIAAHPDRSRTPVLLALPAGSGNSSSRNLWGERTVPEIIDAVAAGHTVVRQLDLLRLEEPRVHALLGASSGFLAQVLIAARDVDPSVKGMDRYFAGAGQVLAAMPDHPTRVTVDGTVLHEGPASSVAVGGGRFRANAFQFLPHSVLDDGRLDVSTMGPLDAAAVAEVAPLVPIGAHLDRPDVTYARGHHVVIERTDGDSLVAEFDGEVWDAAGSRLTIDIIAHAVPALAAPGAVAG
jgi:diacylglycerol kinase (ATP)